MGKYIKRKLAECIGAWGSCRVVVHGRTARTDAALVNRRRGCEGKASDLWPFATCQNTHCVQVSAGPRLPDTPWQHRATSASAACQERFHVQHFDCMLHWDSTYFLVYLSIQMQNVLEKQKLTGSKPGLHFTIIKRHPLLRVYSVEIGILFINALSISCKSVKTLRLSSQITCWPLSMRRAAEIWMHLLITY